MWRLDYRHVIDHLLRKPGAFERYRYREPLFPSRSFREAYDHLVAQPGQRGGAGQNLRLLKLASEAGESELKRLDHFPAVIWDDMGYVQQDRQEMEILFTFLAERYGRRRVLLSSNLVFSKWDQIVKDPMTTLAAIDRLVHHATILEFNNESVRGQQARGRQKGQADSPAPEGAFPQRLTLVNRLRLDSGPW